MFDIIKSLRTTGADERMLNNPEFLQQVYCKSDADCMAEVLFSCVVSFPVSEAIVESWGSVIDKVISDKVGFKKSSDDSADISEKFVFVKTAGPSAGAVSNRRLFKQALTLMYNGSDYPKHFMQPDGKGMSSKVVTKISEGNLKDTIFY